jgi:hypothetical protein
MNQHKTTLERAYELASSGECSGIGDVRAALTRERFSDVAGQLYGPTIQKQLNRICREACKVKEQSA